MLSLSQGRRNTFSSSMKLRGSNELKEIKFQQPKKTVATKQKIKSSKMLFKFLNVEFHTQQNVKRGILRAFHTILISRLPTNYSKILINKTSKLPPSLFNRPPLVTADLSFHQPNKGSQIREPAFVPIYAGPSVLKGTSSSLDRVLGTASMLH